MSLIIKIPLLCFIISTTLLSGCTHKHLPKESPNVTSIQIANPENRFSKLTDEQKFQVVLRSNVNPIPIGKIHQWTLNIKSIDGSDISDAKIYVNGSMPAHQHDFPTKPRTKKYLGDGDYLVEGIKFNMRGHWTMRFTIKHQNTRDSVLFDIQL